MKKVMVFIAAFIMVASVFSFASAGKNEIRDVIKMAPSSIQENAKYATFESELPLLHSHGYPMLPYKPVTYTFPAGTVINGIEVKAGSAKEIKLDKKIAPAEVETQDGRIVFKGEGSIYSKDVYYPSSQYDYRITAGLKNGRHTIFLTLYLYPYRYNAVENSLLYTSSFDVSIDYKLPNKPVFPLGDKDLLIIAPSQFKDALQPLIEHKEKHGIRTMLMTVEDILSTYNGRDDAEKVKYAIKDAIEQHGIKYVMLVGGLSSTIAGQTWLTPVRYSHLDDDAEGSYLTDLYFSDIYKYEDGKLVFDNWDSNGNGVYAEWSFHGKDVLDLNPDVYIGRLACRSVKEVQTVVNKIITYEDNAYGSQWFHRAVMVGGDTFPDGNNIYEGELANAKAMEILGDEFNYDKVWYSEGNLNQQNVINAINGGEGILYFSGHGSPGMWLAKDFTNPNKPKYILGLDIYHMPSLKNDGMYPVTLIGGCHNSMFNATLYDSISGIIKSIVLKYILGKHFTTWYWGPVPECFGWSIVKVPNGAIGSMGCTGLGYGAIGDSDHDGIPDSLEYYLTRAEIHFFELYKSGLHHLGEIHSTDIADYITEFNPMQDKIDCKTVQEWVLLGDPTLMIGGYS